VHVYLILYIHTVVAWWIEERMKGFEGYKLHAAKARLSLAVNAIVERHRTAGRVLTWRLAHEIEKEAMKTLERAGDLDLKYVRMLRFSRWGYVPKVDEPANLTGHKALPVALTMIQKAYQSSH
jgi:hypothetical protein